MEQYFPQNVKDHKLKMKNLMTLISQQGFMTKNLLMIIAVFILVLSFHYASADVVDVLEVPGNTIIPIQQNDVRMLKEVVEVKKTGIVDAIFTLENTTNKNISFSIGFPFKNKQEPSSSRNIEFGATNIEGEFIAKIDGKEVTVKEKMNKYITKHRTKYNYMYIWPITFKPKEKKIVECFYPVLWSFVVGDMNSVIVRQFTYITKTGALWKGTIGQADFYVEIDKGIPTEWIKQKKVRLDIKPKGYKIINYRTVEWHFRNWKPTEDISITIWQNK